MLARSVQLVSGDDGDGIELNLGYDGIEVQPDYAQIQKAEQSWMQRWKVGWSFVLVFVYIAVGGFVFWLIEGRNEVNTAEDGNGERKDWTFLNAIYFCSATIATIGMLLECATMTAGAFVLGSWLGSLQEHVRWQ